MASGLPAAGEQRPARERPKLGPAPPGCADDAPLPFPFEYDVKLTWTRGGPADLDKLTRGKTLPAIFDGTVIGDLDPTLGERRLTARVCVDVDGRVACAGVLPWWGSGDPWFERRVERTIGSWTFSPYLGDGEPAGICTDLYLRSPHR